MSLHLPKKCACGQEMHATKSQIALMEIMHKFWGDYKPVKMLGGKMYKVPVYYIIVHGLKYETLPTLGFKEITS